MTKLAIFDLDGTLLNTLFDLAAACNLALRECGCPEHEIEEYKMLVGRGNRNLILSALPPDKRTEEFADRMWGIFSPYYDAHKCDFTKPYDGIPEMLERLEKAGVKIAIASNKYQAGVEGVVANYFGQVNFVKILGQQDGRPIKPSPEIVGEIMSSVQDVTKEEVVYVGDSNVDMLTGANAGVFTVGVTWGFRSREELVSCNPSATVDNPEELTELLLNR